MASVGYKYLDLQLVRHVQMQCTLKQEYSELTDDVCEAVPSHLLTAKSHFCFLPTVYSFGDLGNYIPS